MSVTATPTSAPPWWTGPWPPAGGPFPPQYPGPRPPSCFSELAALNSCYDDIRMMEKILTKVITDLMSNDPELVKSIVEAIAKSGSNVPLIGVTNGSNAQPGQVGEFVRMTSQVSFAAYPVVTETTVSLGVLQPGDWDLWAGLDMSGEATGLVGFNLNPSPAGVSNDMHIGTGAAVTPTFNALAGPYARGSFTVPTLLSFYVYVNQNESGLAAGTATMWCEARRRR